MQVVKGRAVKFIAVTVVNLAIQKFNLFVQVSQYVFLVWIVYFFAQVLVCAVGIFMQIIDREKLGISVSNAMNWLE